MANHDSYEGKWENGHMQGFGIYVYAPEELEEDEPTPIRVQNVYEGNFDQGRRTEGTMFYSNGDDYVGSFDENGYKVTGVLTYFNGDSFSGDF